MNPQQCTSCIDISGCSTLRSGLVGLFCILQKRKTAMEYLDGREREVAGILSAKSDMSCCAARMSFFEDMYFPEAC